MIRRPGKELYAWRPAATKGTVPPPAPYSYVHDGVWHPYFGELLTEWLDRIGMPKARYGQSAPEGAERVGVLKGIRMLVRCGKDDPRAFLSVVFVRSEDVDAVLQAADYDPRPQYQYQYTEVRPPFSRNGKMHYAFA